MLIKDIQNRLEEILPNAVEKARQIKHTIDYVAWSVLTRFALKQLEHDAIGVDYFS